VHTRAHLEKIRSLKDQIGVDAGVFTPMGRGSFDIALLAAGGVIAAADAVLDGKVRNAYALVRPPGHHALPDLAMGFCIFGNGAITGRHLLDVRKLDLSITSLKRQYDANPSEYTAERINTYIRRYNKLVESLNTRARNDIKQGAFQTDLQIYAFADAADLQLVIAHEFGHALGIGHVANANAVMSARQQVGTAAVQLTDADAAALREQCH
jgi:hypothetical protein